MKQPPRLVDKAYDGILKLVGDGEIQDGDQFTFTELSGRLGMSRMPVAVALDRLQRDGVIESIPRLGSRLRKVDAATVWGLIRWRVALECEVAREANRSMSRAQRRDLVERGTYTDEAIDKLSPKVRQLCEAIRLHGRKQIPPEIRAIAGSLTPRDCETDVDTQFHLELASLSGAARLRSELERALNVMSVKMAICETVAAATAHAIPPEVPPNHEEIARAIAEGTADTAAAVMRTHIEQGFFIYGFSQWYSERSPGAQEPSF